MKGFLRVADQIAETATQSADQMTQFAQTLEAVVGKMSEVQEQAENTSSYLSQRIGLVDERVKAIETTAHVRAEALERVVNRIVAHQSNNNDSIEQAIADIEERHAAIRDEVKQSVQSIDQRHSAKRQEFDQSVAQAVATVEERSTAIRDEVKQSVQAIDQRYGAKRQELEQAIAQVDNKHTARTDELLKALATIESRHSNNAAKIEEAHAAIAEFEQRFGEGTPGLNEIRKAVSDLEARYSASMADTSVAERQDDEIARISETVDRLTARNATNEVQIAGTLARLDGSVAKLEANASDNGLDRRVYGLERAIADVVGRLEGVERSSATASGTADENFKTLGSKIEAADRRSRDAIAELRAALQSTSSRLEIIEGVPHSELVQAPVAAPIAPTPAMAAPIAAAPIAPREPAPSPGFDLPPFPEADAPPAEQALHDAFGAPPAFESDSPFGEDMHANDLPMAAESMDIPPHAEGEHGESYLAAARRSAKAAHAMAAIDDVAPMRQSLGGFTWGAGRQEVEEEEPAGNSRALLIGGIVLIAILAIGAGVALSSRMNHNAAKPVVTAPAPAAQTTLPMSPAPTATAPATVPAPAPTTQSMNAEPKPNALKLPPAMSKVTPPTQTAAVTPVDQLTALANKGNANAELLVGLKYLQGDGVAVNEAEASKWLSLAAAKGEPLAEYRLGTLYERGHGVVTDAAKAAHCYQAAAEKGNRKAMHNLAVAYAEGAGVAKNYTEAARWFSKAATLGLADSQFNLAVLYERGMGVPQSLIDAYKWYAIAAAQGDTESKARVTALSTQISNDDRVAAQKAADSFKPTDLNRAANIPPDMPTGASHG